MIGGDGTNSWKIIKFDSKHLKYVLLTLIMVGGGKNFIIGGDGMYLMIGGDGKNLIIGGEAMIGGLKYPGAAITAATRRQKHT